ncbi:MAG: ATP-binding protein [Gammaproteobacteria bacterium]|nr:ATP-binding protein [Gammaproteobacteria bacterium]
MPTSTDSVQKADWRPLRYFNLYRLILSGLFVVLVFWGVAPLPVGQYDTELFRNTAIAYFFFGLVSSFANHYQYPGFHSQVFIQIFVDIVAITLLMHASGGITSGFGMLLVIAVAGGSVLTQGRIAILFAAMGSIAVLTQQIYVWLESPFPSSDYTQSGILGAVMFATAYIVYLSAGRIRASELLAAKREVDLANLSQLNEHIIHRMQAGILAIDGENRIRLINESAARLLELSDDVSGRKIEQVVPKIAGYLKTWREDRARVSYLFEPQGGHSRLICTFAGIGENAEDGVLVFLEDAAMLTQQAQQLKLASLGRMAASIAHEIRNPLGAISHAGQLLKESDDLKSGDRRLTEMILENSRRMNAIIENVLQLSRRKPAEPQVLNLRSWLNEFTINFIDSSQIPPDSIRVSVEPGDLQVRADPSQLYQVIWNLCENGIKHGNGAPEILLHAGISNGTHRPYLDVRDNGDGISPEVLEQIFEPFYTTREDGSGLGLYIARELCEGNKASLDYVPGEKGACFRINFSDPGREELMTA